MLLPLITYPYLIRVLGKETYGLIVFAQAIVGYLVILVGFGFNISATKEISVFRNDKNKLNEIFSSVIIIKVILFFLSIIILISLLFFIPQAYKYRLLFFLTLWMCLYDVIFPIWYFQGIEQMKYITYITLLSRLTFVGLIFVFVHSVNDYLFIPIINGIGALVAGTISLYIIFFIHNIKLIKPTYSIVKQTFRESLLLFFSSSAIQIYLNANKVVVGMYLGLAEVAYFDLGQKLLGLLKTPLAIISQTIFPKVSVDKDLKFLNRLMFYTFWGTLFFLLTTWILAPYIVITLGGLQMMPAINVIRILAISIVFVGLSQYMGSVRLVPFGYTKSYTWVTLISLLFYALSLIVLIIIKHVSLISLSWLSVFVDVVVAISVFYVCVKNKLF